MSTAWKGGWNAKSRTIGDAIWGAADIVGIDGLALLVGLEAGFLLYGCHGVWCLGVDWSTRV